jgi:hypothetical protein
MTVDLDSFKPPTRSRGCWVCHDPIAAQITIQIRTPNGGPGGTRSVTRSFCERHLVRAWSRATDGMMERR